MFRRTTWQRVVLAILVAAQSPLLAADQPADPQAADKSWAACTAGIERIEKRLEAMQAEFQAAQPEQQAKLREEAIKLVEEIKGEFRTLSKVAPAAYPTEAAKPAPAGERAKALVQQAMGLAYQENRYADAVKVAEAMLKVDPQDAVALNISGVSHFATHNFAKSVEELEQAQTGNMLIPELGGHYLDTAKNYVKYWEIEHALREKEAALTGDQQLPRVLMRTTKGDILLELFEDNAPNTVANFISLVEKGYYNGSPFHRVIPNFMAQGGTPGDPTSGADGPGYSIDCECYRPDARRHFAGTLSMAHAGKDTGGSQFFITHLPTAHLDKEVMPTSVHTVFGRVVEGLDVACALEAGDKIVAATVVRKRNHPYVPQTKPSNR